MSFYTSLTGLKGAQTDLNVISNNVANAGSTGFKRKRFLRQATLPPQFPKHDPKRDFRLQSILPVDRRR